MYTEMFSLLMPYTSTTIFKTWPPLLLFSAWNDLFLKAIHAKIVYAFLLYLAQV
jgi:hypothetical protein